MTAALTPEIIDSPNLWRLYLEVTDRALEVVAYSTYHDQSLIHRRLPLDPAATSAEQALGNLIYDNELLLADFDRVSILIDTPRYMVVPGEITDDIAMQIATAMWGDDITVLTDPLPVHGVKLITGADRATASLMRRTYPTVTPLHPMSRLITYFYNTDRMNNASRMYLYMRDDRLDIIHFDSSSIKVANSFATTNADDMLYYTLLVAGQTGFDMRDDDVMVCGLSPHREAFQTLLRKYAGYVMPVVFPSQMYHAGKAALESPFELIVTPLCE